jgi:phospholysine phosphohistidine inorganic pyrophosphate phosphatase
MDALLIDLDGVIYEGETTVPGAAEALATLDRERVRWLFVTNTTSRPRRDIARKLAGMGIDAGEEKIFTPPLAARAWLATHTIGPIALLVPEATRAEFADCDILDDDAERGAAAVVVGDLGRGWSFDVLNRAFRLLMDEPAPRLVALGMTRYWRAVDGLRLDVAPFVKALEHAASCEATVLGKPSPAFFEAALATLGATAGKTLMIGDDVVSDVAGSQQAGIRGVLVKTGKFLPRDLERGIAPDAVLDSIAALPELLFGTGDPGSRAS